jgi:DNA-directed RNA polymerase subunit omega
MPGGPAGPSGVVLGRGVIDSAKNLVAFFQVQSIQLVRQTAASEFTLCTPLPLVLFLFMALAEIIPFDQASQSGKPTSHGPAATDMRSDLVEQASRLIPHPPMLINVVSQRVRQLNQGRSPMVDLTGRRKLGQADIALLEIIEGKIAWTGNGTASDGTADGSAGAAAKRKKK